VEIRRGTRSDVRRTWISKAEGKQERRRKGMAYELIDHLRPFLFQVQFDDLSQRERSEGAHLLVPMTEGRTAIVLEEGGTVDFVSGEQIIHKEDRRYQQRTASRVELQD
jgi:hypothetical protein